MTLPSEAVGYSYPPIDQEGNTCLHLYAVIARGLRRESGQTLVEYALIISIIALGAIVALALLGASINDLFGDVAKELDKRPPPVEK